VIQPQRLKKLFRRMLDIYSPSGKETDLLEYLHGYLKRHQLHVSMEPVDDDRYNLVVMPQNEDPYLALIGHVDTVAAYDLDDYGFSEDGDTVYGLGAADMKGGCAAMIEAMTCLAEEGDLTRPVALCLVVGEEENGDGAEALMQEHHFPWALIGEPTDLTPCLKSYGYLECQLVTQGKRRHASLADPAQNAIEVLLAATLGLSHHITSRRPEIVYNIRDVFSSQAGFAVPARCEGWFDIHVPPELSIAEILTDLEEAAWSKKNTSGAVEMTFRATTIDAGYMLPERGKVVETLKTLFEKHGLQWKPDAFRSHSDANRIWAAGTRPILLGPGGLAQAHTEEEAVSFQQVCRAAELYLDLALEFS